MRNKTKTIALITLFIGGFLITKSLNSNISIKCTNRSIKTGNIQVKNSSMTINGITYSCNGNLSFINGRFYCNGKPLQEEDVKKKNNESTELVSEQRRIDGITKIQIDGPFKAKISEGEEESLIVSTQKKYIKDIISEKGWFGYLRCYFNSGNYSLNKPVELRITTIPGKVSSIQAKGSSNVTFKNSSDNLDLNASGSSKIKGKIKAKELNVKSSGSSKINLSGKCNKQTINVSGSGRYSGKNLECDNANIQAKGSGKIYINAKKALTAILSGSARLSYKNHKGLLKNFQKHGASEISTFWF